MKKASELQAERRKVQLEEDIARGVYAEVEKKISDFTENWFSEISSGKNRRLEYELTPEDFEEFGERAVVEKIFEKNGFAIIFVPSEPPANPLYGTWTPEVYVIKA